MSSTLPLPPSRDAVPGGRSVDVIADRTPGEAHIVCAAVVAAFVGVVFAARASYRAVSAAANSFVASCVSDALSICFLALSMADRVVCTVGLTTRCCGGGVLALRCASADPPRRGESSLKCGAGRVRDVSTSPTSSRPYPAFTLQLLWPDRSRAAQASLDNLMQGRGTPDSRLRRSRGTARGDGFQANRGSVMIVPSIALLLLLAAITDPAAAGSRWDGGASLRADTLAVDR